MYLSTNERRIETARKLLIIASELDGLIFMYGTFMLPALKAKAKDATAFLRSLSREVESF